MGDVLILLPGTTGTSLIDQNQTPSAERPVVWPWQVLIAALLHEPDVALGLLEGSNPPRYPALYPWQVRTHDLLSLPNSYHSFIHSFESDGWTAIHGRPPQQPDVPPANQPAIWGLPAALPAKALITFPYDWRQDNATTALWFRSFLSAIVTASGGSSAITLVGHSMGGLVARAYLETVGKNDPLTANVQRLITLGTPHLGAPMALDAIANNLAAVSKNGFHLAAMDTVIWEFVNSQYDSTFELLPPSQTPFIDDEGTLKSIFPFSGLSADLQQYLRSRDFSLDDAQRADAFLSSLHYAGAVPYFCAYGSELLTPVSFQFSGGTLTGAEHHEGDGIVPMTSAMFAGTIPPSQTFQAHHVHHGALPGNPQVLRQVKLWMGAD